MGSIGKTGLMKLSDVNFTLFFTGGVGLETWAKVGNLDREITIYKRLSGLLNSVNFVTYGGIEEKQYEKQLDKMRICTVPWSNSKYKTIIRLLFRHWRTLLKSDILKTNQILGAEIPVWLKKHFGKKLIVRCGYLYSRVAVNSNNTVANVEYAHSLEKDAFTNADMCIVTSDFNRNYVIDKYSIDQDKVVVIPNYVDTELFKPLTELDKKYDLVFVGRGGREKNLISLLDALAILRTNGTDIRLLLMGGCFSDSNLKKKAESNRIRVTFLGNVRNNDLPQLLNQARIFILPSLYEGNPKVLLEAMSCALPCIGTDVEGINSLITHNKTGLICNTDAESISEAIHKLMSNIGLRSEMGKNARRFIMDSFSLEKVLGMEINVIQRVINQ